MPRERKKDKRIRQIYRWLAFSYPTPYPTQLKLVRGKKRRSDQGWCFLRRRVLVIHVDHKYPLYSCIDTLIHEYAHAMAWSHASLDAYEFDHNDAWGLAYAKAYRNFNDEGGDRESWEF